MDALRVALNPLDANLDFEFNANPNEYGTLSRGGFGYMWSGARANLGITGGKFFFRVRVGEPLPVDVANQKPGIDLETSFVARLGVSSLRCDVGHLGEVRGWVGCPIWRP